MRHHKKITVSVISYLPPLASVAATSLDPAVADTAAVAHVNTAVDCPPAHEQPGIIILGWHVHDLWCKMGNVPTILKKNEKSLVM
jgi:hypothetical protein